MKRVPLLLFALALGACSADVATPTDPMVAPPEASFAKPVSFDNEVGMPIAATIQSPCTGEQVDLTGNIHFKQAFWYDGTSTLRRIQANTQGVSGVADSGTRYNYIETDKLIYESTIPFGLPWSQSFSQHYKVVTSGSAQNYDADITQVVGQDADGNYYSELTQYKETCR